MNIIDDRLAALGVRVPEVLLPEPGVDLERWAVIACDQHTSEPEYWENVERFVGDAPSTLRLIYPEVYLGESDPDSRIARIRESMLSYMEAGILRESGPGMVLTRRRTPGQPDRRGLLLAIDLDAYDYRPGAQSLVRATEETIVERLPPRVRIRKAAPLELPHILVLVDDQTDRLFGGLDEANLPQLYDTDLMLGGGSVSGRLVAGDAIDHVADALEALVAESDSEQPFLFAMGDGNHSLATAKAVWDESKASGSPDERARYALVEVTNIYDPGLTFEPIHRLVTGSGATALQSALAGSLGAERRDCRPEDLEEAIANGTRVGLITKNACAVLEFDESSSLPVAEVQRVLNESAGAEIDYIHGWEATARLGRESGGFAIMMPPFPRDGLYPYIDAHGVLPRKAFSLGEAEQKRYYLEARRIS